jgi:hypothetical protein
MNNKIMLNTELMESLDVLKISQTDLAKLFMINSRTVRRWVLGETIITGPARAAIRAWINCEKYGINWREFAFSRRKEEV